MIEVSERKYSSLCPVNVMRIFLLSTLDKIGSGNETGRKQVVVYEFFVARIEPHLIQCYGIKRCYREMMEKEGSHSENLFFYVKLTHTNMHTGYAI